MVGLEFAIVVIFVCIIVLRCFGRTTVVSVRRSLEVEHPRSPVGQSLLQIWIRVKSKWEHRQFVDELVAVELPDWDECTGCAKPHPIEADMTTLHVEALLILHGGYYLVQSILPMLSRVDNYVFGEQGPKVLERCAFLGVQIGDFLGNICKQLIQGLCKDVQMCSLKATWLMLLHNIQDLRMREIELLEGRGHKETLSLRVDRHPDLGQQRLDGLDDHRTLDLDLLDPLTQNIPVPFSAPLFLVDADCDSIVPILRSFRYPCRRFLDLVGAALASRRPFVESLHHGVTASVFLLDLHLRGFRHVEHQVGRVDADFKVTRLVLDGLRLDKLLLGGLVPRCDRDCAVEIVLQT